MKKIQSFTGIKALAMVMLFWWHSWIENPRFDVGARMCEILFVMSGFLMCYNHLEKGMDATWKQSIDYTKDKVIQMWPLHFLSFLIFIAASQYPLFSDKIAWVYAALNLSLVQAWFSNELIRFSFNGASWFISALLFCYFITPLLLLALKKRKNVLFLLPLVICVREFVEFMQIKEPGGFGFVVHVNPIIRAMEYFIGMMFGVVFLEVKKYVGPRLSGLSMTVLFSAAEIGLTLGYIYAIYHRGYWMRGTFVVFVCVIIFVFAFDCGILSRILSSAPLRMFGTIQFEFYILHLSIINLVQKYFGVLISNEYLRAGAAFALICLLSAAYKKYLSRAVARWMGEFINKLEQVVFA